MRFCELKEKEVVNICNGKCLGGVVDLQINVCSGAIEALIVPGPGKFCGFFGTDSEYVIPFACIKKIGPDIILVEIKEEKFFAKILDIVYNEGNKIRGKAEWII
ncbi:YlmC/YmxH family sporulation protein [Ruminococcus faecis]|uniref:YlmC/YmxH family sporulation protein n=1 Tax=Mediterraneibacter faecis TaxID=592978 RepID=A0A844KIQ4_9FIRM|nr:YlmC/YmxH family sporulation protein [Mediterraneibacter faecis]MTR77187.1 YlmC/YmxH family sporulation protein [Mediterraneibacter faecis]